LELSVTKFHNPYYGFHNYMMKSEQLQAVMDKEGGLKQSAYALFTE